MDVDVAPLPFGDSYWDYLPDLVQDKILKMAHKQLWKSVNAQIGNSSVALIAASVSRIGLNWSTIGLSIGILRLKKGEPANTTQLEERHLRG